MHCRIRVIPGVLLLATSLVAQTPPTNVAPAGTGPQRFSTPAYPVPYPPTSIDAIKAVLDRVFDYLWTASEVRIVDRDTDQPVTNPAKLPANPAFARTDFLLMSYEWGVTYSGMLLASEVTGDIRYADYVSARMEALAAVAARQRERDRTNPPEEPAQQRVLALHAMRFPQSLDDSGSLCAAMIKTSRAGRQAAALRPWIDNYIEWIHTKQFRLADGTLARNRPLHNALWLDDLYMSVPALAQMGALTGEGRYFDDAVRQIAQFADRMFVPERGLFMHGWIQEMDPHPHFFWARANGWAIVAMAELLSVLPETHPGRERVLEVYRAHARGLAALQDAGGLWHQLLDRSDSYLETSAAAMYVYAIARGVNRGWLDHMAYGAMLSLGWNAVTQKVNAQGQVEGTCVGTGMGFDPAFYYYRPTSVFAAHGYGPVLLAGAEMITFRQGKGAQAQINGGAVQMMASPSRH
jgi:rhamnogalacturonyl hydrolase YesR